MSKSVMHAAMMLLISTSLFAQEVKTIVEPKERPTKNILFVVDCSGSMHDEKLLDAVTAFSKITKQPIDDMHISVIGFTDTCYIWAPQEKRWFDLPNPDMVAQMEKFLLAVGQIAGDTLIGQALESALSVDQKELTIVVISDGIFQAEMPDGVMKIVDAAQAKRKEPALIITMNVGPVGETMKRLGEKGGCYQLTNASKDTSH